MQTEKKQTRVFNVVLLGRDMCQTISWLGAVTPWSLRRLSGKLKVMTTLKEVAVPGQEITGHMTPPNIVYFPNVKLFLKC